MQSFVYISASVTGVFPSLKPCIKELRFNGVTQSWKQNLRRANHFEALDMAIIEESKEYSFPLPFTLSFH